MLKFETVEPITAATATVIWLHGLGADGNDFVPIVPHLKLPDDLAVRFIFPHAPIRPVTCNGGYEMRAWYDILQLTEIRQINELHLQESQAAINELIASENKKGIPSERIVLIGFSQGGAVAYHTALHHSQPLAGLIALSTYLGISHGLEHSVHPENKRIPIYIGQGLNDTVVTPKAAKLAYNTLGNLGYDVTWHDYPIEHEVSLAEIRDVGRWITGLLS